MPPLLRHLARHRGPVLLGISALLLVDGIQVVSPWLMKQAVDDVQAGRGDRLGLWALVMLAVAVGMVLLRRQWRLWLVGTGRRIRHDLRRDLLAHAIRQPAAFHARMPVGELMSRATADLDAVHMACGFGVMALVDSAFLMAMAAGAMLWHQPVLALWVLAPLPVLAVLVGIGSAVVERRQTEAQERLSALTEQVREWLAAIRLVKAYAREPALDAEAHGAIEAHTRAARGLTQVQVVLDPLTALLAGSGALLLLWQGGGMLAAGTLTAGSFTAMAAWLALLTWPMQAISFGVTTVARGQASLRRVQALLDEPPAPAPAQPLPLPAGPPSVQVRGLTFAYPGTSRTVLAGLELDLPPGAVLGVVGPTGSGKTTLAHLLVRLEEPPTGTIHLWGLPLTDLDSRAVRRRSALVPQDPVAFAMSLAENIAFARPEAPREAILAAATLAGLGPDLARFPAGLDTRVGERGVSLSGGQRQRLAIARALMAEPDLLILDDCLSAVDAATEAAVLGHLRQARAGRTTIIVAHRLSAVRDADAIVVLDLGRIVARGTHAQLRAQGGWYADLAQLQEHHP